jgi:hypothetical protein
MSTKTSRITRTSTRRIGAGGDIRCPGGLGKISCPAAPLPGRRDRQSDGKKMINSSVWLTFLGT